MLMIKTLKSIIVYRSFFVTVTDQLSTFNHFYIIPAYKKPFTASKTVPYMDNYVLISTKRGCDLKYD